MRNRVADPFLVGCLCLLFGIAASHAKELMKEHYPDSAMYRWRQKPVSRRLVLDDMEGDSTICKKVNLAELSMSTAEKHGGRKSLRMQLPIRGPCPRGNFREGKAN